MGGFMASLNSLAINISQNTMLLKASAENGSINTNDGTAGGGQALDFWGQSSGHEYKYLDESIIKQFAMLPYVRIIIATLILLIMVLALLKVLKVRTVFKEKGMMNELSYIEKLRRRDASILRANNTLAWITKLVKNSPLTMAKATEEYWQYNINRVGIRIPGGSRVMKAEELYGFIQFCALCGCLISLVCMLVNVMLTVVLIVTILFSANILPMLVIRSTVAQRDLEIKENFADYYIMLHYVLIADTSTPLSGIMKSFARTTDSQEMVKYIDTCISYFETYGEYEGTRFIGKDFREVPEIGKLMRLIRQNYDGGDIKSELQGFRTELLAAKKYAITKRSEKLIAKAKRSFNILMIILVQAVLSAMAIYLPDLGSAGSIFGL